MTISDRPYFQLEQAREVASVFARHKVDFLFIGKGGAIILGYPAATQDVDLFPRKTYKNGLNILSALKDLGFEIDQRLTNEILDGRDFVQINNGPFDLDLVFAPDGIESFDIAQKRMHLIDGFPVANIRDIIASKRATGREKDRLDLPLLEEFCDEFEKTQRGDPKSSVEIALDKTRKDG